MSSRQKKQRIEQRKNQWYLEQLKKRGISVSVSVREATAEDIEFMLRPGPPGTWGIYGPDKRD